MITFKIHIKKGIEFLLYLFQYNISYQSNVKIEIQMTIQYFKNSFNVLYLIILNYYVFHVF